MTGNHLIVDEAKLLCKYAKYAGSGGHGLINRLFSRTQGQTRERIEVVNLLRSSARSQPCCLFGDAINC